MTKKKSQYENDLQNTDTQGSDFLVPFTVEELHRDVLILFVHQIRTIVWMTGPDRNVPDEWTIFGKVLKRLENIYDRDLEIEDISEELGLTYADITNTAFAIYLNSMYQYAYFGRYDVSLEPMEDQSAYTWQATILFDFQRSAFLNEWNDMTSGDLQGAANRCLVMAELANARRILESGEVFSYLLGTNTKDEEQVEDNSLTIRQMSLLAGMEEMSIRAAANPKRVNPLPTFSDGGRTRISNDAAKTWLKSKGRYIPITRQFKNPDIDLTRRSFSTMGELLSVIQDRRSFLSMDEQHKKQINMAYSDLGIKYAIEEFDTCGFTFVYMTALSNMELVHDLANILEFPADLFALRVRETLAKEELVEIHRELKMLGSAVHSK